MTQELVVGQKYKVRYLGPDHEHLIGRTFEVEYDQDGKINILFFMK